MTIYWVFQIINETTVAPKLFPSLQDREHYITNTPMDSYRVFQYDIEDEYSDIDLSSISHSSILYSVLASDSEDDYPWLQSTHTNIEEAREDMVEQIKKDCCLLWLVDDINIEDEQDIWDSYWLTHNVEDIDWVDISEMHAKVETDYWRTIGYLIQAI
jgi:hypothetical protein